MKNKNVRLGAHPRTEKAQFVFECLQTLRRPHPYLRGSLQA